MPARKRASQGTQVIATGCARQTTAARFLRHRAKRIAHATMPAAVPPSSTLLDDVPMTVHVAIG
jgi:hypothetical protein